MTNYKIFIEDLDRDKILFETGNPKLAMTSITMTRETNASGILTFGIPVTHSYFNLIETNRKIEVYLNDLWQFTGEIVDSQKKSDRIWSVTVLGISHKLHQVMLPYREEIYEPVSDYLEWIMDSYNDGIKQGKWQIALGDVEIGGLVYRQAYYDDCSTAIGEKLIDRLGGVVRVEKRNGILYLDYLNANTSVSKQKIILGSNLLSLLEKRDHSGIVTAIIPLGAKLSDDSERRLEINVNGNNYVYDQDAVDRYGWRYKYVEHDDITLESNLIQAGYDDLELYKNLLSSFELTAIDLSKLDKRIEEFRIGEFVHVYSKPDDVDVEVLIYKIYEDILNPVNSKVYCGATTKTLTSGKVLTDKEIANIKSNYVVNQQFYDANTRMSSEISQNAESILLRVEYGEVSSTLGVENDIISILSNRLKVDSTHFKLSLDGTTTMTNANITGTLTSTAGKIGNWELTTNGLKSVYTQSVPAYTLADATKIQEYILGTRTLTSAEIAYLDADKNGYVNSTDYALVRDVANGTLGRTWTWTYTINSAQSENFITLVIDRGNDVTFNYNVALMSITEQSIQDLEKRVYALERA